MPNSFTPQQIEEFLQEFFDVVGARQYIGARYVPIFGRAGEDTVEWDDTAPYEPLTVVMHQGVSYVSRRYVPNGIQINNTDYWVETYRFNAQVEQYRQEVLGFSDRIDGAYAAVDGLRDEVSDQYVPFPTETSKFGEVGQVLSTAGMGETEWVDPVIPDADDVAAAVSEWLGAHPEATTTVTDGSVTDAKLASSGIKNIRGELQDILLNDMFYPVNGNIVFSGRFVLNGFYTTGGNWTPANDYRTALLPTPKAGTYQTRKSRSAFGDTRLFIQLLDGSGSFIRNISATDAGNQIIQFTITDADSRDGAYIAISYKTNEVMPMVINGTYPTNQTFVEPVIQFSDNLCLRYMGTNPSNLNTLNTTGYWNKVSSSATGVPEDAIIGTTGFIIVFANAFDRNINLQILVEPNNPAYGRTIWMRTINSNGTVVYPWYKLNNQLEQLDYLKRLTNRTLPSLSGNIIDVNTHDVLFDKFMMRSGEILDGAGLNMVYVPIFETGNYVSYVSTSLGNNTYIYICNKDKNYLRRLQGTNISGRWYSYDLDDELLKDAYYVVVNYNATNVDAFLAKMDEVPTYQNGFKQRANFDYSGESLFKKILVCDGDSICKAASDLPTLQGGWWGRTARAFFMGGRNYGIGGGTITAGLYSDDNPRHWVCRSIDTIHTDYANVDYLLLEGGTNDADLIGSILDPQSIPAAFGSWSENDFSGTYDDETFCGAVETLFYKAINYYPNSKIGFIIPMEMGTNTNTVKNRRAYFDEIVKIAGKWHIPVLDLWNGSHMDARLSVYYDSTMSTQENINAGKAYQDGQHPTNVGYDMLQNKIQRFVIGL